MSTSNSNNQRVVLELEHLDSRDVPAGNVTMTLTGGGIGFSLLGDANNNQISVQQTALGDVYVFGLNGTTINGLSSVYVGRGIPVAMNAVMGAGNDYVEVQNLRAGSIVVRGEAGTDTIIVRNVATTRNIELYGGPGNDTISASYARAGYILYLDGKDGFDMFHIDYSGGVYGFWVFNMERQF